MHSRLTTEETKDRNMGTEIFRKRAPKPYFSVHIFLSDPASSFSRLCIACCRDRKVISQCMSTVAGLAAGSGLNDPVAESLSVAPVCP